MKQKQHDRDCKTMLSSFGWQNVDGGRTKTKQWVRNLLSKLSGVACQPKHIEWRAAESLSSVFFLSNTYACIYRKRQKVVKAEVREGESEFVRHNQTAWHLFGAQEQQLIKSCKTFHLYRLGTPGGIPCIQWEFVLVQACHLSLDQPLRCYKVHLQ